jgi:tetratricopeptide (TPR) repeat protein
MACALLLLTIAVYSQVATHEFVNYDDPAYITANPHVQDGWSWNGVVWAFTSTEESNWFPLTRLSHLLDGQVFGASSAGPHLENVLLHALNAMLLLFLLKRATGRLWPSTFVAAAFALHPLHVESVAWAAERKDVLSTFFSLLTIRAYLNYVERRTVARYLAVAGWFVCALMAKPMAVTLPFALLILDFWPLRRLPPLGPRILEKTPIIALSAASSAATYVVQNHGGAVAVADRIALLPRLENALTSYVVYLVKFVWPAGLAVFYPYVETPAWEWIASAMALVGITIFVLREHQDRPFLAAGWFWYLGMLAPVIGLVQVGAQARADRYTYLPLAGIAIMIGWSAADLIKNSRIPGISGCAIALIWCGLTWRNVENWQNSETLFSHALEVTGDNYVAHNNLGDVYRRQGRFADAAANFASAVRIQPESAEAQDNLGESLTELGKTEEAIPHLEAAIRARPDFTKARIDLGSALVRAGRLDDAAAQFQRVLNLDPRDREAEYRLAGVLMMQGKTAEAIEHFKSALPALIDRVRRNAEDADAHYNLGEVYGLMGRNEEAAAEFSAAVRLRPEDREAHFNLGVALSNEKHLEEAAQEFSVAARLKPDDPTAHLFLARTLASLGRRQEAIAEYQTVLQLAPDLQPAKSEFQALASRR